jgi:hypothetical protein
VGFEMVATQTWDVEVVGAVDQEVECVEEQK